MSRRSLPKGCVPSKVDKPAKSNTIGGSFSSQYVVSLENIVLPEFDRNKRIDHQQVFVFDGPCRYDLILGRDFCRKAGIHLDLEHSTMQWMGQTIPFKDTSFFGSSTATEDELDLLFDLFPAEIRARDYKAVDPQQVAQAQTHLTQKQRNDLASLFKSFDKLFSGKLGKYTGQKVHLELKPGAVPVHSRPYSVPRSQLEVFKDELEQMVRDGVLRRVGATEWASPSFIIPKKGGTVRWVSDFRALNKVIRRRQYPLPRIQDILLRRAGYSFFTKIDLTMQYYTFELDDESQELTTIVTPFGKFQYQRLPMGISCAPDIAQQIMEDILRDIENSEVYLDDVGAFSNDWDSHLLLLEKILSRLQDAGFTVNPAKCEWGVKETDWLGYWLTPEGLKPWKKKIDGILKLDAPKNLKQLRSFLGAVNYYRDLFPRRSHVLRPLTDLTGRSGFHWDETTQRAFDEMKALIASDALMAYPDHNLPFEIYTDASDYQLGACIMQRGRPVAYYSRKLTSTQLKYTTMEKELLSIVYTLKEFRSMLLGAELHVYTDHKNLTYSTLNSSRVLRWRLFLEEYDVKYHYIEGSKNVLADAFSRLPRMASFAEGKSAEATLLEDSLFTSVVDDDEMLDCFLNLPPAQDMQYPLDRQWIQQNQFNDVILQATRAANPQRYPVKYFGTVPLMCYKDQPDDPEHKWRIYLPNDLLDDTIRWFHLVLGHAGKTRVYDSIRKLLYNPGLKRRVDMLNCEHCQRYKLQGAGYGELPPREAELALWQEAHTDLIGPWEVEINGTKVEFNALTTIDPVSNIAELIRIDAKTSAHIRTKFEQSWLARYPWPVKCVHDNGGEFSGWEFQQLLQQCGIQSKPTTSRNPTANAICERMHQTVGNVLRVLVHAHPPPNVQVAEDLVDQALATAIHTLRSAVTRTLSNHSPAQLAFNRDMFLNIPFQADLQAIQQRRQLLIDTNLMKKNAKRRSFDYQPGGQVLVKADSPSKLGDRSTGPYIITQVHTNGTITIQRSAHVTERLNIRRVYPYRPP